jgi:hypothetical protein
MTNQEKLYLAKSAGNELFNWGGKKYYAPWQDEADTSFGNSVLNDGLEKAGLPGQESWSGTDGSLLRGGMEMRNRVNEVLPGSGGLMGLLAPDHKLTDPEQMLKGDDNHYDNFRTNYNNYIDENIDPGRNAGAESGVKGVWNTFSGGNAPTWGEMGNAAAKWVNPVGVIEGFQDTKNDVHSFMDAGLDAYDGNEWGTRQRQTTQNPNHQNSTVGGLGSLVSNGLTDPLGTLGNVANSAVSDGGFGNAVGITNLAKGKGSGQTNMQFAKNKAGDVTDYLEGATGPNQWTQGFMTGDNKLNTPKGTETAIGDLSTKPPGTGTSL